MFLIRNPHFSILGGGIPGGGGGSLWFCKLIISHSFPSLFFPVYIAELLYGNELFSNCSNSASVLLVSILQKSFLCFEL